MKIKLANVGAIRQAEFELGDLTIICGKNNTGKTYATYALYGFLDFWENAPDIIPIDDKLIGELLESGTVLFNIDLILQDAQDIIRHACKRYSTFLSHVFASSEKKFKEALLEIRIETHEFRPVARYELKLGSPQKELLLIHKEPDERTVEVSLLVDQETKAPISKRALKNWISHALKETLFSEIFPPPFIASVERTGAAIFRKELDFRRNRIVEELGTVEWDSGPLEVFNKHTKDYALPVRHNVDFVRQLESISKEESFIAKEHSELLEDFAAIIGGEYKIVRDELQFIPKAKKNLRLTMIESSSAVRSLLAIGFYLRHVCEPGDLLIVDEPELNLHPENQRLVARLFARLINLGVRVFITTHSDYIIKELNTLIMLNQDAPAIRRIAKAEGYEPQELISHDKVRLYTAEERLVCVEGQKRKSKCQTLTPAKIDPQLGMEAKIFDDTINEMNRIQESIMFSAGTL